jgi:hypothetical protein
MWSPTPSPRPLAVPRLPTLQVEIPRSLWKADPERQLKWCAHRSEPQPRKHGTMTVQPSPLHANAASQPAHKACATGCPKCLPWMLARPVVLACTRSTMRVCVLIWRVRRAGKFAEKVMKSTSELESVVTIIAANERQMRRTDPLRKYMDLIVDAVEKVRRPRGAVPDVLPHMSQIWQHAAGQRPWGWARWRTPGTGSARGCWAGRRDGGCVKGWPAR